jgi:hypothetical protein
MVRHEVRRWQAKKSPPLIQAGDESVGRCTGRRHVWQTGPTHTLLVKSVWYVC